MSPAPTEPMYCWSCGTHLERPGHPCPRCGTEPPALRTGESVGEGAAGTAPHEGAIRERSAPLMLKGCPACGFRGEGIPYFRRAGNMALLAAATLFTYGVGGVVYWLLKRTDQICPSCGLSWERARPLGEELRDPEGEGRRFEPGSASSPNPPRPVDASPTSMRGLPRSGIGRRVMGALIALMGLLIVGIGVAELEVVLLVVGGVTGLTGALTFGWGWKSLQLRREAIMQRMQRRVLHLARARSGRLTATDVATELDLTLNSAERVLLSLDDGFRIRSDVTDEGILVFEFPELQLGAPGDGDRGGSGAVPRTSPEPLRPE